jgi:hypothetical protein
VLFLGADLAFGLDHIIIWRDRPTDLGATRYLDNTSTARGKPSIVVEAGYAGIVESDDVALLVDGTIDTMRALKMLSGDPRPIENPVWLDKVVDVLSDGPGIWYPLVKRGTYAPFRRSGIARPTQILRRLAATAVSQKLGGLLETTLRRPRVCAPVSRPLHPPRRHLQPSTGIVGRRPSHLSLARFGGPQSKETDDPLAR